MRRGIALGLTLGLLAPPAHAMETTYRLGVPYFVDPGVGALFPGGQRIGGGAELAFSRRWSVSIDTQWLHHDWGTAQYTLSLTPLLLRHRLPIGPGFMSVGAGGAAMTLAGGHEGFRVGVGPAFAVGLGLPMGRGFLAQLELQQGAINAIRYVGLGFNLGFQVGSLPPTRLGGAVPPPPKPQKPPLPQGTFMRVGQVEGMDGQHVRLVIDDLPYQVQPGDVLVVYYQDQVPIKIAKVRVEAIDPDGRHALGAVVTATEAVRRGYWLGTL